MWSFEGVSIDRNQLIFACGGGCGSVSSGISKYSTDELIKEIKNRTVVPRSSCGSGCGH